MFRFTEFLKCRKKIVFQLLKCIYYGLNFFLLNRFIQFASSPLSNGTRELHICFQNAKLDSYLDSQNASLMDNRYFCKIIQSRFLHSSFYTTLAYGNARYNGCIVACPWFYIPFLICYLPSVMIDFVNNFCCILLIIYFVINDM